MMEGVIIKEQEFPDFFQVLQYYRHDVINELQLVQAYLSMNNYEKVKDKMDEIIANFHKERHLISLQMPKFVGWVLQFNHVYSNITLTYDIEPSDIKFTSLDDHLVNRCNQVIKTMKKFLDESKLYDLHLQTEANNNAAMKLKLHLSGLTKQEDLIDVLLKEHSDSTAYFEKESITYEYVLSK